MPEPTTSPALRVVSVPYDDPVAQALVGQVQQEYVHRYGGPDDTPMEPAQFAAPDGTFLVLVDGGTDGTDRGAGQPVGCVGCVGFRRHDPDSAEIKRLFVVPSQRGRGLARLLLDEVERRARERGYRRLVLETGSRQPEAIALYESRGYLPTEPFGRYACSPTSRHLALDL